jgi:hypothetical protein
MSSQLYDLLPVPPVSHDLVFVGSAGPTERERVDALLVSPSCGVFVKTWVEVGGDNLSAEAKTFLLENAPTHLESVATTIVTLCL